MTAREYLEQIEKLDIKIKQREDQLARLRETAGGAAAIRYDKLNVQVSIQADIVEKNVLEIVELEEKVWKEKIRLEALRNEIIEQIQKVEDKRYMNLLYKRYVKLDKFEQIALDMHYDYVYIRGLHSEALEAFDEQFRTILHNLTLRSVTMKE